MQMKVIYYVLSCQNIFRVGNRSKVKTVKKKDEIFHGSLVVPLTNCANKNMKFEESFNWTGKKFVALMTRDILFAYQIN
jgi:hypothetical protein